jgi:threonine dehydratase
MPLGTPIAKVAATQSYGARVVLHGNCYDEAFAKAMELQKESGAVFVHPFDDEDVMAGQATVAIEILRDLPTVDEVLVPAGGGGLISGIAYYIKQINPRIRVVGVQAEGADAIVRSFRQKSLVPLEAVCTIAAGIAVKRPGRLPGEYINKYVDDMVTVSDAEIAEAILLLLERSKMVVEPAGAAALAAALHGSGKRGSRKVCVLSGGNIDVSFIHKIVEKGLVTRGRQMKFSTVMPDIPGSLRHFSTIVADCGANIIMVQHDRLHTGLNLNEALLHIACEVGGPEHAQTLIQNLEAGGYRITMEGGAKECLAPCLESSGT